MHWGMGGRIATASLRTGLAMTPFESLPLPFRASAYTGVGISGADDPVRRVRGLLECIGAGLCPHSRRKEYPCMNSQHKRGARRGIRRRDHAKARHEIGMLRYAGQKVTDAVGTSAAERIPKPLVLAAFFGYFLSLVTESVPPEARHSTQQGLWQLPLSHGFAVTAPLTQGILLGMRIATWFLPVVHWA